MINRFKSLLLLVLVGSCAILPPRLRPGASPPDVQREMRGLWVATVRNIDWPSRPGLSADSQKTELIDIMNRSVAIGMNTIVLQVRPATDALYRSTLEPWGAMLTGTQGVDPGYDPLEFAIAEAHARGLQLHVWINPFRVGNTADSSTFAATHVFNTRRDLVRVYGGNLWLDPGDPESRERSMAVVTDIVRRYDIDGLHADDYFYPYPVNDSAGRPLAFPDDSTFAKFGGGRTRDDWRRSNIDAFLERMYRESHAIKPSVAVGLSPFGIWRPGNPPSVKGLDAYDAIYADSRKWLQQGWVDYLVPQLYWAITAPQQSFPDLLTWWTEQSAASASPRHVWPGLATYRVQNGTATAFSVTEIPDQIRIDRKRRVPTGQVMFNTTTTLKKNDGAIARSIAGLYARPALVPAYPWLDASPPPQPTLTVSSGSVQIIPGVGEAPRWWILRFRAGRRWTTRTLFADARTVPIDPGADRVLVQAVDQAGNVSTVAEWRKP